MLDTMTFTKIAASLCGALLVLLLGQWAAEELYHVSGGKEQAYVVDTGADDEEAEETVEVAFADVFAAADASAGQRVFRQCSACHKLEDGENAVGPHLYAVVGRDVGSTDYGSYSGALNEVADVWSPENLNAFLENPRGWAPGTSMGYNGLRDVEDRANLIAYLDSIGN
ncbi:c-type cytochrome [uncultured Tateyamaria sp.]|uniref:c-type cytochrome n=1 Tax=uncultured Tateyamaria sp. TaxID=455651 RepID=UPI0026089447|nr:c-type cytochrome [uncultured Tateyamaria sp.]